MPAISMFYGIIIYMYFMDNKQHHKPHIHAKYQNSEVIVAIPDGEILGSSLLGMVRAGDINRLNPLNPYLARVLLISLF